MGSTFGFKKRTLSLFFPKKRMSDLWFLPKYRSEEENHRDDDGKRGIIFSLLFFEFWIWNLFPWIPFELSFCDVPLFLSSCLHSSLFLNPGREGWWVRRFWLRHDSPLSSFLLLRIERSSEFAIRSVAGLQQLLIQIISRMKQYLIFHFFLSPLQLSWISKLNFSVFEHQHQQRVLVWIERQYLVSIHFFRVLRGQAQMMISIISCVIVYESQPQKWNQFEHHHSNHTPGITLLLMFTFSSTVMMRSTRLVPIKGLTFLRWGRERESFVCTDCFLLFSNSYSSQKSAPLEQKDEAVRIIDRPETSLSCHVCSVISFSERRSLLAVWWEALDAPPPLILSHDHQRDKEGIERRKLTPAHASQDEDFISTGRRRREG